jgi:hypothetical protein
MPIWLTDVDVFDWLWMSRAPLLADDWLEMDAMMIAESESSATLFDMLCAIEVDITFVAEIVVEYVNNFFIVSVVASLSLALMLPSTLKYDQRMIRGSLQCCSMADLAMRGVLSWTRSSIIASTSAAERNSSWSCWSSFLLGRVSTESWDIVNSVLLPRDCLTIFWPSYFSSASYLHPQVKLVYSREEQ